MNLKDLLRRGRGPEKSRREYLAPWRVDCRLARELPDDRPVRKRFVVQLTFAFMALIAISWAITEAIRVQALRTDVTGWRNRLAVQTSTEQSARRDTQELQAFVNKIDEAHRTLQPVLPATAIVTEIAQLRPGTVTLDRLSLADGTLSLHGLVRGDAERASRLVGDYVKSLRTSKLLQEHFASATLTSIDRGDDLERLQFEITLRPKPAAK